MNLLFGEYALAYIYINKEIIIQRVHALGPIQPLNQWIPRAAWMWSWSLTSI